MVNTQWINKKLYPFTSHYFETPAGNLHYIDEGKGDPIIFLHGVPDWSFLYRNQIKELSTHYRCIAIDHIGFGLSDKPQNWDYLPASHAENLTQLINKLQLKNITFVMNDWGGPIGFSYAVKHPENIKALIVMNTWTWPLNREWYYQAFSSFMGGPIGRYLITRKNIFVNAVIPASYGKREKLTEEIQNHYRYPFRNIDEMKGLVTFPGQIIKATPWLTDIWNTINQLKDTPLLVMWGMKDIAFRKKELDVWKETFPKAEVNVFDDAGHYPHEEYPQETSHSITRFLSEAYAKK